jgi:hypothetical protein
MELSRDVAEEIARRIGAASTACEDSLRVVMAHQSLGEATVYGRLVATFMAFAFTNILRPIWNAYPDLEPQSKTNPNVEPVPVLAPEADAALRSFVSKARAALAYAQDQVSKQDQATAFTFGGLREIEGALREIEVFREHPRFRDKRE